jgi:hypothetical protein
LTPSRQREGSPTRKQSKVTSISRTFISDTRLALVFVSCAIFPLGWNLVHISHWSEPVGRAGVQNVDERTKGYSSSHFRSLFPPVPIVVRRQTRCSVLERAWQV